MASRSWMGLPEFPRCSSWPRLLGACRCTGWFLCRGYCGNGSPARGSDSLSLWTQPSRSCPGASMTSSLCTCTMGTIWGSRWGEGGSVLRSCRPPPAPWPSRGRHLCQRGSSTSLPAPWRRWVGGCFSRAGRPPLYSWCQRSLPSGEGSAFSSFLPVQQPVCPGHKESRFRPQGLSHRGQVLQGLLAGWGEQGSILARAPSQLGIGIRSCKSSGWGLGVRAPSGESWEGVALWVVPGGIERFEIWTG